MSAIPITLGDTVTLSLVLGDGVTSKYPQAIVYSGGVASSTLTLAHVAEGMYSASYTPSAAGEYEIAYTVYSDAGHTTPDTTYEKEYDLLLVGTAQATSAELDAAVTTITGAISTSEGVITDAIDEAEAAIIAVIQPSGLYSCNIILATDDGLDTPISDASIAVYDSTGSNLIARGVSNTLGYLVLRAGLPPGISLDAGTYSVRTVKAGFNFSTTTIVVSADADFDIAGTPFVTPTPSTPDLCVIYGTVLNANGQPVANAVVKAQPFVADQSGGWHLANDVIEVLTNASGYYEMELVRGVRVIFSIEEARFSIRRTVPDLPSQSAVTWSA